jgi:hypothetical protein
MTQATCTAYRNPPEMEKLSQLRAKTDRQLLDFIHSKLDETSACAVYAQTELSNGRRAEAQESLGRADRAFAEAQTLLLLLNPQQRRGFDRKLHEISENLNRVCRNQDLLRPLFFIA